MLGERRPRPQDAQAERSIDWSGEGVVSLQPGMVSCLRSTFACMQTRSRVGLAALFLTLAWSPCALAAWQVRTIAQYGEAFRQPDIVVDAAGVVHVFSYPTLGFGGPAYVTNRSQQFAEEDFPGSDLGIRPILTRDADGNAAFVLSDADTASVSIYRFLGGAWTPSPIGLPDVRAIAFDRAGHAHAIFFGDFCDVGECGCGPTEYRLELRYGTDRTGAWTTEVVATECRDETVTGSIGSLTIVADAAEHAHAAWLDGGRLQVRHATNAAGSWSSSVVADVGPDTPAWDHPLALAADSGGHPHVLFYDDRDPDLAVHYATDTGSGWQRTRLRDLTAYPSVVVTHDDVLHVVVDSPWRSELSHFSRATSQPIDAWQSERVAAVSGDSVPGLALDANERLHVAYYETPKQSLRYATAGGGGGGGGGTISEDTTVVQVGAKPTIRLSCARTAPGPGDACVAQAFAVGDAAVAGVTLSHAAVELASGDAVTKEVSKPFGKKKVTTKLKLKLNPVAKKVLKMRGTLDVEVRAHLKSDPNTLLKRLLRLVRKR